MSIVTGIQTGIVSGIRQGINGKWGKLASLTNGAQLAARMGFANSPTWMAKGNEATGATDLVGSDNFSTVGSPTEQEDSPYFDDSTWRVSTTADQLVAASSTPLDVGAQDCAFLWVGEIVSWDAGQAKSLFGKRELAGNFFGWELITNTSQFRFTVKTTAGEMFRTVANSVAGPFLLLGVIDYNATATRLCTNVGTSSGATLASATATNAVSAALGLQRLNPAVARHALAAAWIGTGARGLTQTHADNLSSYLGI